MGLSVSVGVLADLNLNDPEGAEWLRDALQGANVLLGKNNLPAHAEPETLPQLSNRSELCSYPYAFLHYLRRFAAHAAAKPGVKLEPFPESEEPSEDPLVDDASSMFDSHLLCHSDAEGFYVPIDFPAPLFSEGDAQVTGGMLGSSQGLMRELIAVAPALGVELTAGRLSDADAERINRVVEEQETWWIEQAVWLSLFEAARLSIEHRTAVVFG